MNNFKEALLTSQVVRLNNPHARFIIRGITNGREPMNKCAGIVNAVISDREKKKHTGHKKPLESRCVR